VKVATEEFIAKATVVGLEQLDRLAAALERVQGAGAGSATAATADAVRNSRAQEEVGQQFQKNAQLAEQFGAASRTAASALTNAMRQTRADVTTTILAMERLRALQQTVGAGLKDVAPTATKTLQTENAFLQSAGTRAQIARGDAPGTFVGIVDGQTTDVQRSRVAAAQAGIDMDLRLTAAKSRELEATLAGLAVAGEAVEATRQETNAKRRLEQEEERAARATEKQAAAAEKLASSAQQQQAAYAENMAALAREKQARLARVAEVVPGGSPVDGGLAGGAPATNPFQVDRDQLQAAVETVDERARAILDADVPGGGAAANRDQIQNAYYQALQEATPALQRTPGMVNATAQAVNGLTGSAIALNESMARTTESARAINQRWIAQLQTPYTPTAAAGGIIPPPGGGGLRGAVGGFAEDFGTGFRGRGELPFAQQFGQVAKFSIFYGAAYNALFAVSQAMKTAVDEAVRYNSALIDLAIATSSTSEEVSGLADTLGRTASAYGLSPATGAEIGTRAVGIFDLNDTSPQQRDFQTTQFTKAVAQLNFVTGRDVISITQDVGAIAQAFSLSASQASQVQDLDAFFSRRFGSEQGGTIETVAQVGTIAESAGFSAEETFALASKLQSRTGQTPQAVAGLLSQFFGRSGDPALAEKFTQLGVDTTQGFREQIEELGRIDLSDAQRLFIENAFGRGRSGGAASAIIQDFPEVLAAAEDSETESAGLGAKQVEERLQTVGGALQKLLGNLQQLAVDFGNSGVLDVLYLAIKALDSFVVAIDNFLALWNLMPRAVRDVIIGLTALALATKYAAASQTVQNILRPGAALGDVLGQFGKAGAASATRAVPAAGGIAGVASRAGAALSAALGGASLAAIGTTAGLGLVAVAAAEAAIQFRNHTRAVQEASGAYTALEGATTSADFRAGATSLRTSATDVDNAQGFLINAVTFGATEREADRVAERLRADADFYDDAADYVETQEELAASLADVTVFGDPAVATVEDFADGLLKLQTSGANAVTQMRLLADAISLAGDEGQKSSLDALYDPEAAAAEFAAGFQSSLSDLTPEDIGATRKVQVFGAGEVPGEVGYDAEQASLDFSRSGARTAVIPITSDDVRQSLDEQLKALGLDADGLAEKYKEAFGDERPTQKQLINFTDELLAGADYEGVGNPEEVKQNVLAALKDNFSDFFELYDPNRKISQEELLQLIEGTSNFAGLTAIGDAALTNLQSLGFDEGTEEYQAQLRTNLQVLRDAAKNAEGKTAERAADAIRIASSAVARGAIARLEGMREVEQAGAETKAEFRSIGQKYARLGIQRALRTGDLRLISETIARAGRGTINNVRNSIRAQIVSAEAAVEAARASITYVLTGKRIILAANNAANAAFKAAAKELEELKALLKNLNAATEITVPTGSSIIPPSDLGAEDELEDEGPTQAQIDAARAQAEAARRGGQISQATAALQSARADLAAAEEGTVEYYNALQQVYEAQRSLADAIRDDRINKFLLANDITDPLVQAQAEVKRARQQLRYDQRNNASPELIREDKLALEEARQNQLATRFQSWFSALQTAESLDRISHAQYIRTLERRAERLRDIKNRTQQQQDQLDQVDQALKAAKESMSGQFNIGDIKVPTPYEIRRYIEQTKANAVGAANQAGAGAAAGPGKVGNETLTNINNNITIDGADIPMIRRILRDLLGDQAIKSTATKTGKR
jgi:TP901 family phage tail tape measure protein